MLTVLEPCDSEYRVRALLLRPRQGVTSLLIGDIRVPAAASYPQFRSLLFFLIYSLSLLSLSLSLPTPPTSLVLPLSLSFSPSLSLSLSLGSALISSRQQAPLVCISSGGAVQVRPRVTVRQGERGREGEREREREPSHAVDASSRRRIPTSGAVFFSHEHQCVINRINLGPNFLMIAVLMYVNECSLLTHYRQFAWDTHNQTL